MFRIILIFVFLSVPTFCFSASTLHLPSDIMADANNPAAAFPEDIRQNFSISSDLNDEGCKKTQAYLLTMLIYRNAVDNKIVATYRAEDESTLCWIDLISYSDKWLPDLTAGGWKTPKAGENTWCSVAGMRNPVLCALLPAD